MKRYVTIWPICYHPLTTSWIFHTRRLNAQENVSYVLDFYVSTNIHFSHFEKLKSTFYTSFYFVPKVMSWRVSGDWRSVFVYRTEIKAKPPFRGVDTSNTQIVNSGILIHLMCLRSLWISVSYGFCEFNRVANWNRGNIITLVWSSIQICQLETLFSNST